MQGEGAGRVRSFMSSPGALPSQHLMCSPVQRLPKPFQVGILWMFHYPARLIKPLVIGNQVSLRPSTSSKVRRGAEIPTL